MEGRENGFMAHSFHAVRVPPRKTVSGKRGQYNQVPIVSVVFVLGTASRLMPVHLCHNTAPVRAPSECGNLLPFSGFPFPVPSFPLRSCIQKRETRNGKRVNGQSGSKLPHSQGFASKKILPWADLWR